mgnify:CR=1 FL=1
MPKYVIDSYAWIEYFIASAAGEKIRDVIESSNNQIITPLIVISEVMSVTQREQRNVEEVYKKMMGLSETVIPTIEMAKEVGILHAEIRKKIHDFGMADTFVLVTARRSNAKIITGDPHFKGFKEAILMR